MGTYRENDRSKVQFIYNARVTTPDSKQASGHFTSLLGALEWAYGVAWKEEAYQALAMAREIDARVSVTNGDAYTWMDGTRMLVIERLKARDGNSVRKEIEGG